MTMFPFDVVQAPGLQQKPRDDGLTCILDRGLGALAVDDLLEVAGAWIDVVKLGWGTSRLTPLRTLRKKLERYSDAGVSVCTGGTLLEVAFAQGKAGAFIESAVDLGFGMIEVSNGVHPMTPTDKEDLIRLCRSAGLGVWTEIGRKNPFEDAHLGVEQRIEAAERELEAGADRVVLEARESGTVGIYDSSGQPNAELLTRIAERIDLSRIVFEAPLKGQQLWMIREFGPCVNLGNVRPEDALPLATLRSGLRGDTVAQFHLQGVDVYAELGLHGAVAARERGGVVIMLDALRASATIVAALASGMAAVRPVSSVQDCVGEVTAGERGGRKLPNVMHGNSPTELLRHDYTGQTLVFATTNGVECLLTAAGPTTHVVVGTPLNASAVAEYALMRARQQGLPITLLMAGRNNGAAPEDALAAGVVLRAMGPDVRFHDTLPPVSSSLQADFFATDSGKNLVSLGYAEDVVLCSQVDRYDVVPVLTEGCIVAAST